MSILYGSKLIFLFLHFRNYGICLLDFVGIFGLLHNLFTLLVLSQIIEQYKQFCCLLNNCSPFPFGLPCVCLVSGENLSQNP